MSNKLITEMGLPPSLSNIFTARNILTAKVPPIPFQPQIPKSQFNSIQSSQDALSLPEFDLASLLSIPLADVRSAVSLISHAASPPPQTALDLLEAVRKESRGGHLPTFLKGLDEALCGGIPFGVMTELVGPSGIGKTQLCLKLALIAALPACYGGLNGRVIYIDTESKFSSRRMIEIGENSFPDVFHSEGMAREMAGRIVVLRPSSLSELTDSLQQMKLTLIQHEVKLLIIDSMAALVSGENEKAKTGSWQHSVKWPLPFLKSLAEFSRVPIVVTNQVRGQSSDEGPHYLFEGKKTDIIKNTESHLTAALGIQWAHAVTIRLIFESHSGHRFIKVAKSPISPPLAFPFIVDSSGISLLSDEAINVMGLEINTIRCQGHSILDS